MAPGQRFRLPADRAASQFVHQLGYWVAWNDTYTVINWGHNVLEMQEHVDYYVDNYQSKLFMGLDGFRQRLRRRGYDLIESSGRYEIIKLPSGGEP